MIFTVINTDKIRFNNTNRCTVVVTESLVAGRIEHAKQTTQPPTASKPFAIVAHILIESITSRHALCSFGIEPTRTRITVKSNDKCTQNKFYARIFHHTLLVYYAYAFASEFDMM